MSPEAALEVKDLSFHYPDGTEALKGISLRVARGERVALIGPNGAGKSTLLWNLMGVLRGKGQIEVGGLTLATGSLPEIRRKMGILFQDPDDQLFMNSVAEDVAFGPRNAGLPPGEVSGRVEWALEKVGLEGFGNRHPLHLSTGEKKRAALAAVLALKPEILILDEPTAGLDPRGKRNILDLLDKLNLTMLIATHDYDVVRRLCTRTLLLYNGRLVTDGLTGDVLSNSSMLLEHGL